MGKILVDNWSLENAAISIVKTYDLREEPNSAYLELLEAIILWDDIVFVENSFSEAWKNILWRFEYEKFLKPLEYDGVKDAEKIIKRHLDDNNINGLVERGALEYYYLCDYLKCNYLPASKRAEYLSLFLEDEFSYNRNDVLKLMDEHMSNYYEDINKKLNGKRLKFDRPILSDFIINNTSDKRSFINTALQLRNEKEIVNFRKWIKVFEEKVKSGDYYELDNITHIINEIVNDVTKFTEAKTIGEFQIGLSPSLTIPLKTKNHISSNKSISFLRTLANESVRNRRFSNKKTLF